MDVKTPSSGEQDKMFQENFAALRSTDEVKFVVQDRVDFDFAVDVIRRQELASRCPLLFSPVHGKLDAAVLAAWILEERVPARLQLQIHKLLWPEALRGV